MAAFLGPLIGGMFGMMGANKQASAQREANAANMAAFNQYKPYVDAGLSGGQGAFNNALGGGYYQGPTYAGPNQFQTGTANTMGTYGQNLQDSGFNMMSNNNQFGQNANNLYGRFSGLADQASTTDRMGNAIDYATANSGALTDSLMRNDRRNLEEGVLPGINMAATGSGNVNSSRAGVAEGVANRGYEDRYADMSQRVTDSLIDRSLMQQGQQFSDASNALSNAGNANNQISNAYNTGMNTMQTGGTTGMNAGGALQGFDQAQMNDDRANFEGNRDFGYNMYKDYMSGMLGKAPTSSNVNNPVPNNMMSGALGGAMQGYGFQNQYFGGQPNYLTPQQEQMALNSRFGTNRVMNFGGY